MPAVATRRKLVLKSFEQHLPLGVPKPDLLLAFPGMKEDGWTLDEDQVFPAYSPVCTFCQWEGSRLSRTCLAFPDGIPVQIWTGENNHAEPYPGDRGYSFIPMEGITLAKGMNVNAPDGPSHAPRGGIGRFTGGEFIPNYLRQPGTAAPGSQARLEQWVSYLGPTFHRKQAELDCMEEFCLHSPVEKSYWLDQYGTVLGSKDGTTGFIHFSNDELSRMVGVAFTHNHPSGRSFSGADIAMACVQKFIAIRAVGVDTLTQKPVRYRMAPPKEGWSRSWWESFGLTQYLKIDQQVSAELRNQVLIGMVTVPEATALHEHQVWTRWAKATGCEYTREDWDIPGWTNMNKTLSPTTLFDLLGRYTDEGKRKENEILFPAMLKACIRNGIEPPDWLVSPPLREFSGMAVRDVTDPPRGFVRAGRQYLPLFGFEKSMGAEVRYPSIELDILNQASCLPAIHKSFSGESVNGEPYLCIPETTSLDPSNPYDREVIKKSLRAIEETVCGLDLLGIDAGTLSFALNEETDQVVIADFSKAAYFEGDKMPNLDRWREFAREWLERSVGVPDTQFRNLDAFRKSLPSGKKRQAPKAQDWDHKMDGLDDVGHSSHQRLHESEFKALQHMLVQCDPNDLEEKRKITQAMRKLSLHWNKHRMARFMQQQGEKKLPKIVLKSFNPSEPRDDHGKWTEGPSRQGAPYTGEFSRFSSHAESNDKNGATWFSLGKRNEYRKAGATPYGGASDFGGTLKLDNALKITPSDPIWKDWGDNKYPSIWIDEFVKSEYPDQYAEIHAQYPKRTEPKRFAAVEGVFASHLRKGGYDGALFPGSYNNSAIILDAETKRTIKKAFTQPHSRRKRLRLSKAVKSKTAAHGSLFAEEEHPRATTGTTGKYRGGEWVPKDRTGAEIPTLNLPRRLTAREKKVTDDYLTAGMAKIEPVDGKFKLQVRPTGATRYKNAGTFPSVDHARAQVLPALGLTADEAPTKAYQDVGERIGGARKEIAGARVSFTENPDAKTLAELEKQDPDAAARAVVKSTLWPKPKIKEMTEAGKTIGNQILMAALWTSIAPKPSVPGEGARKGYLNGITILRQVMEPTQSAHEFSQALDGIKAEVDVARTYIRWQTEQQAIAEGKAYRYYGKPPPEPPAPNLYQANLAIAMYAIPGIPATMGFEGKERKVRGHTLGSWIFNTEITDDELYDTDHAAKYRVRARVPLTEEQKQAKIPRLVATLKDILGEKDPVEAKAKEAAESDETGRRHRWERSVPTNYERQGGKQIDIRRPEDYLTRFGLRGVEFGNWMSNDASKVHVDRCAEAFQDLADILGLPAKDVSLNGRLALAFGARGKGFAAAHYEPEKRVINLTKLGGAGTLGHEWGHFLDDILATVHPPEGREGIGTFISDRNYAALMRSPDPVKQSVGRIFKMIYNGHGRRVMKVKPTTSKTWSSLDKYIERNPGNPQAALDDLGRIYRVTQKNVDYIGTKMGAKTLEIKSDKSAFYERCAGMGDYWKRPHELFARAFEMYLLDAGAKKGRANNYLVHLSKGDREEGPYPTGLERDALTEEFGRLFEAMKGSNFFAKALRIVEASE